MLPAPDFLVALPLPDAVADHAARQPLRVIMPSLARGGAERIVIEWLSAEAGRGRAIELAVIHRRRQEYSLPAGIVALRRGSESAESFVDAMGARWRAADAPVSAHLVTDALLARLWACGVRTVPVLHNTREGWRNDPSSWPAASVPFAVACADSVRAQVEQSGCLIPVVVIRHRPRVGEKAIDESERRRIREEWGIGPGTFVVGVVGAFKAQKDHSRAVEVLAALRARRNACLVILGGTLDRSGLAELDRAVSRAVSLGVADALRLPGFVDPIEPWYAAFDALLNVSRHEGLSIATQEALAAGLPVIATDVGGQGEIDHSRLQLLPVDAPATAFAQRLAGLPVRESLCAEHAPRFPRAWTLATSWRRQGRARLDTVFATANLNAGGAQRSLVNLATAIARRHRFAIAVCGESTHPAFPERLARAGVDCFRPAPTADPFDVAEGIIARTTASGARNICFWNADPAVKLLVARFAPRGMRLVDACPGAYAYEELESAATLGEVLAFGAADYYRRLDALVTKFDDLEHPWCRRVEVIPNGVALRDAAGSCPGMPRFLVSGRIAPSKRLGTILEAFCIVAARFPGARLDIVGQAEPRHREYLDSLHATARGLAVTFRGALPGLEFLDESFTAAIVLGTHQGCPNAVLEAMAAGIAVIANASGGTGELVLPGETGWLLSEACTPAELACALGEAADDAGRSHRLGLAARDRASRRHSLEAMAVRYLCLFDPVAERAPENQDTATHAFPQLRPA
ncbi:MAG: glycosyltransferase [Betaproteobacteria bacterium]|nr:glycosyltransferase [Betaproteobacteria bacterium]